MVEIPAWTTSLTSRIVKAPKQFLVDSGLTAHLLGVGRERLVADPHLAGPLLEAIVGDRFRQGVVLHGGEGVVPFGPKLVAAPLSILWR